MSQLTEHDVLDALDHSFEVYYDQFVMLGHVYSYLIDTRLNVFRHPDGRWAIAIERLGYSLRAGYIELEIYYYGNCLVGLDNYNGKPVSSYSVYPIEQSSFEAAFGIDGLGPLITGAHSILVRGQGVALSHNPQDYADAGIHLMYSEAGEISIEEAARLFVPTAQHLFRATHEELHRSIPVDLRKILVLDEWFHKDFYMAEPPTMTGEHLRQTYELNASFGGPLAEMGFDYFAAMVRHNQLMTEAGNKDAWENHRPSTYETWQLIAKVIATNNAGLFRPSLPPNTHWSNWPESGSL